MCLGFTPCTDCLGHDSSRGIARIEARRLVISVGLAGEVEHKGNDFLAVIDGTPRNRTDVS